MLKLLNLKEIPVSVEDCRALLEIEIENGKMEGVSILKVLHGYGSHGKGGVLLSECRSVLQDMKKKGQIKDYFNGDKWNLFDKVTISVLERDKSIVNDEDINRNNPGITVVVL